MGRRAAGLCAGPAALSLELLPRQAWWLALSSWPSSGWWSSWSCPGSFSAPLESGAGSARLHRRLAYAHEAARFAGRPGLPDHALVFSLTQAGVYLFHNGPDRKPFLDGRLEVPSRATFEAYVRLNQQLATGGQEWSDVLRQMGDPLILLDHDRNFRGEATLLVDPRMALCVLRRDCLGFPGAKPA